MILIRAHDEGRQPRKDYYAELYYKDADDAIRKKFCSKIWSCIVMRAGFHCRGLTLEGTISQVTTLKICVNIPWPPWPYRNGKFS